MGFMEMSRSALVLPEFVFRALSYHTFDEQCKKMHLIVPKEAEYMHVSLQS